MLSPNLTTWCTPLLHSVFLLQSYWLGEAGVLDTISGTTTDIPLGEYLLDIFKGYKKMFRLKCTFKYQSTLAGTFMPTSDGQHGAWHRPIHRPFYCQLKRSHHVAIPQHTLYTPLGLPSLGACSFWSISFTFLVSALFQNLHIINVYIMLFYSHKIQICKQTLPDFILKLQIPK